jgi:hypothetical protein
MDAYIEDNSANGTYVNDIRLGKTVRRILCDRDRVSLVNPRNPDGSVSTEAEASSFYVDLFTNPATKLKSPLSMLSSSSAEGGGNGDPCALFSHCILLF